MTTGLLQAADRFWSKVEKTDTCWLWTSALDNGYGRFWVSGRSLLAHRVSYELSGLQIPDGMQLDHVCRNRACVNPGPDHLEPVDLATNVLRGAGLSATNKRKTHCLRDHLLDEANTYITPSGARQCITCQRQRVRNWRARGVAA